MTGFEPHVLDVIEVVGTAILAILTIIAIAGLVAIAAKTAYEHSSHHVYNLMHRGAGKLEASELAPVMNSLFKKKAKNPLRYVHYAPECFQAYKRINNSVYWKMTGASQGRSHGIGMLIFEGDDPLTRELLIMDLVSRSIFEVDELRELLKEAEDMPVALTGGAL